MDFCAAIADALFLVHSCHSKFLKILKILVDSICLQNKDLADRFPRFIRVIMAFGHLMFWVAKPIGPGKLVSGISVSWNWSPGLLACRLLSCSLFCPPDLGEVDSCRSRNFGRRGASAAKGGCCTFANAGNWRVWAWDSRYSSIWGRKLRPSNAFAGIQRQDAAFKMSPCTR